MKTLEEIEKEYEGFTPVSTFVTNRDELITFLGVGIDDTIEIERDYIKELRENKKDQIDAKIRNFFFFIFEQEEVEFYDEDNELIKELRCLVLKYRELYERMISIATDSNAQELVKLVDFLTKYYNDHIDYFEDERDRLELWYKGIRMYNSRHQDNRKVIDEFADKKLAELEDKKAKTYVKKETHE